MTIKTADSKGRINFGNRYAHQTVIIEEIDDTEMRVTKAQVIPQRELWLHKNPKAKTSLRRGLAQAKAGKAAKIPPNLKKDALLAEQLND
jgi:hypothetical protein